MLCFFLILDIIFSAAAIFGGYYMKFRAPEDTDKKIGFLTESAKKSSETWKFANMICGKYWIRSGIAGIVLSTAATDAAFLSSEKIAAIIAGIAVAVIVILMSCSVTMVMMKLRSNFDENGKPNAKE